MMTKTTLRAVASVNHRRHPTWPEHLKDHVRKDCRDLDVVVGVGRGGAGGGVGDVDDE